MQVASALSMPAKSLRFARAPIRLPKPLDNKMGHLLLSVLGFYSQKSQLLHGGQELYSAIKEQCDDGALQKGAAVGGVHYAWITEREGCASSMACNSQDLLTSPSCLPSHTSISLQHGHRGLLLNVHAPLVACVAHCTSAGAQER